MEQRYNTIKIPTELIDQIDLYMTRHKHQGFTTRVEVIKASLRDFLKNNSNENYQLPKGGEERTQTQGGMENESLDESGRSPEKTTSDTLRLHDKQNQPQTANTTGTPDQKTQKERMKEMGGEER